MAKAAPRIMSDTAVDAKSTLSPCMNCSGTGLLTVEGPGEDPGEDPGKDPGEGPGGGIERPCPSCLGRGSFRVPGHDKSRELFYKTMGLTKREPLMAQQINIHSNEAPTVEDFVMETEKALKDGKRRR